MEGEGKERREERREKRNGEWFNLIQRYPIHSFH